MHFALKSLGPEYQSTDCYFQIRTEQHTFYSPFYSDQQAALDAMRELVLRLRNRKSTKVAITEHAGLYQLQLFGKKQVPVASGTPMVDKMEAIDALDALVNAAPAFRFPLVYMELQDDLEEVVSKVQDLVFSAGDEAYEWKEVKESALIIEQNTATRRRGAALLGPSIGVSPFMGGSPCEPLFNLLQPQMDADLPFFMGRKEDADDLFALTRNNDLLLLYGPPRVGKTSLIQCGLSNCLKPTASELIVQPWKNGQTEVELSAKIRAELEKIEGATIPEEDDPKVLLASLQSQLDKPVYVVFDQLERLFDKEVDEEERSRFFTQVEELRTDEEIPCRIILSLREGFLAPLADYEHQMPSLLSNRYRVQPLSRRSMMQVSLNLFDIFQDQGKLKVDDPEELAEKMTSELANEDGEVSFQCMQIYMHQMQQKSCSESGGQTPLLDPALLEEMGSGRSVIDDYLTKRLAELESSLPEGDEPADPAVLEEMDLLRESREHCGCGNGHTIVPVAAAAGAGAAVGASQRLRRVMWVLLSALLFGSLTYWVLSGWAKNQDPCHLAVKADSCEAYLNYLSQYGNQARCAEDFRAILEERACAVWSDYQLIQQNPTCGTYQTFYDKYRNTAVSTDHIQRRLIEWECPMVRDTVEVEVRDTIYQQGPSSYDNGTNGIGRRTTTPTSGPGCAPFDGTNFKKVGPLWFMTDPLPGGPYSWEEALDACSAKGWRLPCVGEVDFLIDNIYRGQSNRAYQMLTGSGECYLLNPSEVPNQRIDFWTGTEANDAYGWTFYFDTSTETIGRESNVEKGKRLPCLCVKKDFDNHTTGLPPCYNKTVDRQ